MERTRKITGPKTGDFLRERNAPAFPFPVLSKRERCSRFDKEEPWSGQEKSPVRRPVIFCGSGMRSDVVETGGLGPSD